MSTRTCLSETHIATRVLLGPRRWHGINIWSNGRSDEFMSICNENKDLMGMSVSSVVYIYRLGDSQS